ncbi:kinesin-like protein KIN-14F isoform X2 [Andrographis paniculata]|uniref:kinesin-like protein KIN-14F isoform X2 n=1 Tax=Andrographis paniculata TaxID=175694 RepID=UPI0021E98356|nr:kinesin-like protein KIN-14F isoform X2 [Andrographis paniculata]
MFLKLVDRIEAEIFEISAAARRHQAAQWLRKMDGGAAEALPKEPTEEEFRFALRSGLILCNVLNKVNPGAVPRVVEVLDVQATEGAAQAAIQYFENMRNFLVSVGRMKLLTFEASDVEKGGSSSKVVDCILCLKGYYEWKQSGGVGVWKYGGTVRITSQPKDLPSSVVSSESADESLDDSESSQYDPLMEFFHLYTNSLEDSRAANILTFMFDYYSIGLLQAYVTETNAFEDIPLNSMVTDIVIRKVVKDFSELLDSQGNQLGSFLKKVLNKACTPHNKSQFIDITSKYLKRRTSLVSSDVSDFCICGGIEKEAESREHPSHSNVEMLNLLQKPLEDLKALYIETKQEVYRTQLGWEKELLWLGHHVKGLEVAAASYHTVLEENRLLYNQVQDLKGTIRVYCRVRPFLSGQSDGHSTVDYIGEDGSIMIVNPHRQGKDARRIFMFNKVFGTNATQRQIYADTQPLVRSVLDGYNVCIFAYGQTGSGKTYTMSGPDLTTEETWGVNYRALRDLFHISKARMDVIKYEVGVQMIEIYNEQVRDLLVMDGSNQRLDIRNNSQLNGLNVPDASLIPVKCTQDVLDLMRIGQRNRAIGATALNERSSRSHSILTVHVRGKELISSSTLKGCLHLVDLAGSERVDRSEAVGDRLKEAQHINRSLSALGDVIAALAQKSSHVPYRNSKLTQVLQDSLGGHAKTLMFVHINPEVNALGETFSTLKFAERVATVELGAAQSNKETCELRECKEEISNLRTSLERKEAELEQLKSRPNTRGAASPLRMAKQSNPKPEISEKHVDPQTIEVRSCSVGKQRRSQYPSKFSDKDALPKLPVLSEERAVSSTKPRSPSPPVRRSTSTDRVATIKTKAKSNLPENLPVIKTPFPASISVSKSITNAPPVVVPAHQNQVSQETAISDALNSFSRVTIRKPHPPHEEEQFKQALNIRQGGIRKGKQESKIKTKHQALAKLPKSNNSSETLLSDIDSDKFFEEAQNTDFLDPEDELVPVRLAPASGAPRVKNPHTNSRNIDQRETIEPIDSSPIGARDNKFSNGKEASNSSGVLEFRRSRSIPRGKLMIHP